MLNSGKKFALRATKKINIIALVTLERKNHNPSLQVKWSVPNVFDVRLTDIIISNLDIFSLICAADEIWIIELTLIHKNIRLVRNSHISQSDIKHINHSVISKEKCQDYR
jgi:DNA-binding XRE family transcriptional regulator